MYKLTLILLLIVPLISSAATRVVVRAKAKSANPVLSAKDRATLSVMISNFDVVPEGDGLKITIKNVTGQEKSQVLTQKSEEFKEYSRYSFKNPYQESYPLELYVFEKIRPVVLDNKDAAVVGTDMSDLRFDLQVLIDSATKKTLKVKTLVYFEGNLIAAGPVENNFGINISDDLSAKIKNYKLQELKVVRNFLGSDKRAFDLEAKYVQGGRAVKQKFNVSLLNLTATPIEKVQPEEAVEQATLDNEIEEPNLLEGESNETSTLSN